MSIITVATGIARILGAPTRAEIVQALNNLGADKGGVLLLPPDDGTMDDEIVLPSMTGSPYGRTLTLQGAGRNSTRLTWSSDLGSGKYGIRIAGGTRNFHQIKDLSLWGPNISPALGASPANMVGVKAPERLVMQDVALKGFRAGIGLYGDHARFERVEVDGCYFGLLYLAGQPTMGDNHFAACGFTGNSMASIGVESGGHAAGDVFLDCHLGYSPYGIYKEAGTGEAFCSGLVFISTPIEAFGNAAIWDNGTANAFTANELGMVTQNASYKIAAVNFDYVYYLTGAVNRNRFDFGDAAITGSTPSPGVAFIRANVNNPAGNVIYPNTLIDHCESIGKPFLIDAIWDGFRNVIRGHLEGAFEGAPYKADEAITLHHAVMPSNASGGNVVTLTTGSRAPLGFAKNTASTNDTVVVQHRGQATAISDGAIAIGDRLKVSASTPGRVVTATAGEEWFAIAQAATGGAGSNLTVMLRGSST